MAPPVDDPGLLSAARTSLLVGSTLHARALDPLGALAAGRRHPELRRTPPYPITCSKRLLRLAAENDDE
jgi:hypothetical protein